MGLGSGLGAFTGGFQSSYSLKMLKKEKERQDKITKEKEENAMNWLSTNKTILNNFQTQSQDVRNSLIYESDQYSENWHKYLTDSEKALQAGDLEELKHLNDQAEERLRIEGDMLELGVTAENGFLGNYYTPESMDYVKKLRMGALSNKPIGTHMYEEAGYGKLPAEEGTPLSAKDNWAIDAYKSGQINFDQLSKYMGTYIEPEKATELQKKIAEAKQYGATNEEIKNMLVGKSTELTPPAVSTTENTREAILDADTFEDAERIYKNHIAKYGETDLGITDLKQEWGSGQISYLNKVKQSIENLLVDRGDKGQWLNNELVTEEMVGIEFEGEQPASAIYEILYKSYIEYLEKLRKLGIDVSQFPELLPLSEIERVGGTEGFFAIKGVKKGDYKSIYK